MAHHGQDRPMSDRLRELMANEPGPTLRHPRGKISSDDDGEITIRMGADRKHGTVIIEFGVPTKWIGFTHDQAREIARNLCALADKVQGVS